MYFAYAMVGVTSVLFFGGITISGGIYAVKLITKGGRVAISEPSVHNTSSRKLAQTQRTSRGPEDPEGEI